MKFLLGLAAGFVVGRIDFNPLQLAIPRSVKTKINTTLYRIADKIEETK